MARRAPWSDAILAALRICQGRTPKRGHLFAMSDRTIHWKGVTLALSTTSKPDFRSGVEVFRSDIDVARRDHYV